MPISIAVYAMVESRPCDFCLCLQEGSVFADFDIDDDRVVLQRISFDGYGCCEGEFRKMSLEDSHTLIEAIERGAVADPKIEVVLRTYFGENEDLIWSDALATHDLL